MWKDGGGESVDFVVAASIDSKTEGKNPWTAVGFNHGTQMSGAMVVDCIYTPGTQTTFLIQSSYNKGYSNAPVSPNTLGLVVGSTSGKYSDNLLQCAFSHYKEVNQSYPDANLMVSLAADSYLYLLLATGPASPAGVKSQHTAPPAVSSANVSMAQNIDVGGAPQNDILYKLHGILMILAWVLFSTIGTLIARYCKSLAVDTQCIGAAVWFRLHQTCMCCTLLLTLGGFVIILIQLKGHFSTTDIHPILGLIVVCLVILNPMVAFLRPAPDHPWRPIFYWTHAGIAFFAQIIAGAAMIFGVNFEIMQLQHWIFYVLLAWVIARLLVGIVLTIHRYFAHTCCYQEVPYQSASVRLGGLAESQPSEEKPQVPVMVSVTVGFFILISAVVSGVIITEIILTTNNAN